MERTSITNLSREEELVLLGAALAGALAKEEFTNVAAWKAIETVDDLKKQLKERGGTEHCE